MIGPPFVLSESKSPLAAQDEEALILAHAYRLAYEDYLRNSVGSRISRFLHLSKPKRVSVIARIAYRLKVVPFSKTEVLVSDSCSACTEKVDVVSMDPRLLADSAGELIASVKTHEDQTRYISQLKAVNLITQGFRTVNYQSPFLANSNPLAGEAVDQLRAAELPNEGTRVAESEFEIADRPEEIRDALLNFLRNFGVYSDGLSKAKDRVVERSRLMISLLKERYPIKEELFSTTATFEWKLPESSRIGKPNLSKPVITLIEVLKAEARPEIDAIERQNAVERGKIEQRSNLEKRELERTHDTQIRNAERDMNLEVRRLESDMKSYEGQLDILKSQYDETSKALQSAEEEYKELAETDSTTTAQRLTDKIARLESERDDLAEKKAGVERTLDNVESELRDTKQRHAKNIRNLRNAKELALENHEAKLEIQIDALEESKRRNISDKLAHATEIEKERAVIEELVEKSSQEDAKPDEMTEKFELPNLWSDGALFSRKISAIEGLEKAAVNTVDRTSKTMDETRRFLQNHLVRLNVAGPSVTVDAVIPFWYVEIESGKHDQAVVEIFVVPPSEVVPSHPGPKEKIVLGITFIPTMPAAASALESVKKYKKVQACGRSSNQINEMNPSELLGRDSKVVREQLISKDFCEAIQSDFKKRFRKAE